jgi:hypothetical protein
MISNVLPNPSKVQYHIKDYLILKQLSNINHLIIISHLSWETSNYNCNLISRTRLAQWLHRCVNM